MNAKDAERLRRAKCEIDLAGYFARLGWIAVPGHDTSRQRCLRGPDGTRVIVEKQPDGHWTFFRTDDGKGGSIFDAAGVFGGATTTDQQHAEVRRALESPPPPIPVAYGIRARHSASPPKSTNKSRPLDAVGTEYLRSRSLSSETIEAFKHRLRSTDHGVQAPHNRRGGEERGPLHRMFSGGNSQDGEMMGRSLWIATPHSAKTVTQILVAESFLDALSAWELLPTSAQYCTAVSSTGGALCPANLAKLEQLLVRVPGMQLFDCSDQGERTTERRTSQIKETAERTGANYVRHAPLGQAKDWNDALTEVSVAKQVAQAAALLPRAEDDTEQTLTH